MDQLLARRGPFPVRFRVVRARRVEALTPRLKRIVVGGAELEGFRSESPDDHVKLAFPIVDAAGERRLVLPSIGPSGLAFPDGPRSPMRDYTPRRFDPEALELTLDFVMHGDGPAVRWAASAAPGDELGVGGPRGSVVVSESVERLLLVGDETALPAIARRLEELPAGKRARVVIEVADDAEVHSLASEAEVELTWVRRDRGESLASAVAAIELFEPPFVAWVAAESGVMRAVRDGLLARGVPREHMRASGYWKRGVADHRE